MKYLSLLCLGLAVGLFVAAVSNVEVPPPVPVGLRGLERRRWIARGGLAKVLDPVLRTLGPRLSRWAPPATKARIDRELMLAGDFWGLHADEYVALSVVLSASGLLGGLVAGFAIGFHDVWIPAFAGAGLGALYPPSMLGEARRRRAAAVTRELANALDLMCLAVGAGLDFPGAARQIVERRRGTTNVVVDELTLMLRGLALGHTRVEVVRAFAERVPIPVVQQVVSAIVQAEEQGNPLGRVLQTQADVLRQKRTVHAEETVAKAATALLGPLVLIFLCTLLVVVAPIALSMSDAMG